MSEGIWALAEGHGEAPRNRTMTFHLEGLEVDDGAVKYREMVPVAVWAWGEKLYIGFSHKIKDYRLRVVETSSHKVTLELIP